MFLPLIDYYHRECTSSSSSSCVATTQFLLKKYPYDSIYLFEYLLILIMDLNKSFLKLSRQFFYTGISSSGACWMRISINFCSSLLFFSIAIGFPLGSRIKFGVNTRDKLLGPIFVTGSCFANSWRNLNKHVRVLRGISCSFLNTFIHSSFSSLSPASIAWSYKSAGMISGVRERNLWLSKEKMDKNMTKQSLDSSLSVKQ